MRKLAQIAAGAKDHVDAIHTGIHRQLGVVHMTAHMG